MKIIILAGGRGTRLVEETDKIPKPMVQVGGKPMLWHLMNSFASQGFSDFIIATGYLSEIIDEWVVGLDEPWMITTKFTGLDTQTGGRLQQCILETDEPRYLATYGDGLANVNLGKLTDFHKSHGFLATLTAVRPPARFGVVEVDRGYVTHFGEKSQADSGWINGGFFVLERRVADYIHSQSEPFETGALPRLVVERSLGCFQHYGFWKPMDTLREKQEFEILAAQEQPPWALTEN